MAKTGRFAMIEQFMADGVTYMFGNPGTVEQGFLDALSEYPDVEYILALQEAVVVGIADGYARATRKPTIVQLHSGVGLGQRDRHDVPGQAGPCPAGGHRRRVGRALRRHGGPDVGRPGRHGRPGHEVGDPRGRPRLRCCGSCAGP